MSTLTCSVAAEMAVIRPRRAGAAPVDAAAMAGGTGGAPRAWPAAHTLVSARALIRACRRLRLSSAGSSCLHTRVGSVGSDAVTRVGMAPSCSLACKAASSLACRFRRLAPRRCSSVCCLQLPCVSLLTGLDLGTQPRITRPVTCRLQPTDCLNHASQQVWIASSGPAGSTACQAEHDLLLEKHGVECCDQLRSASMQLQWTTSQRTGAADVRLVSRNYGGDADHRTLHCPQDQHGVGVITAQRDTGERAPGNRACSFGVPTAA